MAVFNVVQKRRRAAIAERKRAVHGDPHTGKVKHRAQNTVISGKRKRKIEKKWRRDQKEAIEKGLITMEDIEMAVADATASEASTRDANKSPVKFHMKKSLKIKSKRATKKDKKGKNKRKSGKPAIEASSDVMVE